MKIIIKKEDLLKTAEKIAKVANSDLGIKLTIFGGKKSNNIGLEAYNGNSMQICEYLDGTTEIKDNHIKIIETKFLNVVKQLGRLDAENFILKISETEISVSIDNKAEVKVKVKEKGCFLNLANIKQNDFFTVNTINFKNTIQKGGYAFSEEIEKISGILFEVYGSNLSVYSCDGHHGAKYSTEINRENESNLSFVLPNSIIQVVTLLQNEETSVIITDGMIFINNGVTFITLNQIKETFPVQAFTTIEKTRNNISCELVLNRKQLLNCIDIVSTVNTKEQPIRISNEKKEIYIYSGHNDAKCLLDAQCKGEFEHIYISSKYIKNSLTVSNTEDIKISISGEKDPIWIHELLSTPEMDYSFIMPVKLPQ